MATTKTAAAKKKHDGVKKNGKNVKGKINNKRKMSFRGLFQNKVRFEFFFNDSNFLMKLSFMLHHCEINH